jgi:hypothetical protein
MLSLIFYVSSVAPVACPSKEERNRILLVLSDEPSDFSVLSTVLALFEEHP